MGKRTETQLEKLKLGGQGWNEVLSRNAQRLNDILLKVEGLVDVDIDGLKDGDVLWWNASTQKFENVPKAYAISAGSVSSASSESSHSSGSSETISSLSSESSELIISNSSSSESSDSSESSFSCGNMTSDLTTGQIFDASNYYSTYVPGNAFDDNTGTSWIVDVPGGWQWIEVQFSGGVRLNRLRIRSSNVGWANTPTHIQLKGSVNGNFVGEESLVFEISNLTWSQDEWKTFDFVNDSSDVIYWRVYVNGSLPQYNICEIEMMECTDYSSSSESSESSSSSSSLESSSSSSYSSCEGVRLCSDYGADVTDPQTAQSGDYDPTHNPNYAFDNNNSTYWRTLNGIDSSTWIYDYFYVGKVIQKITMRATATYPDRAPTAFRIQRSNTAGSWVTVKTVTGESSWSASEKRSWTFENSTAYKYWRILVDATDHGTYCEISEIEMMECSEWNICSSVSSSSESSESSESIESSSSSSSSVSSYDEITVDITANADDGLITSANLYNDWDYVQIGYSGGYLHGFVRFDSVALPKDANIVSAKLRFKAYANRSNNTCNWNIYIEDADDPAAPSTTSDYNSRSLGTVIPFSAIEAWVLNNTYDSPDFTVQLENHLKRAGWVSGQAIQFLIKNNNSTNLAVRDFYSRDQGGGFACQLIVQYHT
jgi:hypothetical protein